MIWSNIASKTGKKFAIEVLDFMRDRLVEYQEETGNMYNLEATPGEGTSYRQARSDKEKYPDIISAGTKKVPYYTNSSQLPVDYTDDAFFVLEPGVNCILNINKSFRWGAGVTYRYVNGLAYENISNSDLSGVSFQILLKFGDF